MKRNLNKLQKTAFICNDCPHCINLASCRNPNCPNYCFMFGANPCISNAEREEARNLVLNQPVKTDKEIKEHDYYLKKIAKILDETQLNDNLETISIKMGLSTEETREYMDEHFNVNQ